MDYGGFEENSNLPFQDDNKNAMIYMRFPQKLWYLLNLRTGAILWGGTGKTILLNYRVLYSYLQCNHSIFKTTNISSFVRQLNLYGFRKVTSHLQDPLCNSSNPYMHEYIHDYFQFGRPELLNKMSRKALTIKKNCKNKVMFKDKDCVTPLQKARRAFKLALRSAVNGMYLQHSREPYFSIESKYDCDEDLKESCDEMDEWLDVKNNDTETENEKSSDSLKENTQMNTKCYSDTTCTTREGPSQVVPELNEPVHQNNQNQDNFPNQFLNMPELDPAPKEEGNGVELFSEFGITITNENNIKQTESNVNSDNMYFNCMLPSINNYPNDDLAMVNENSEYSAQYHGEWDQMFNDMIGTSTNKSTNQDTGTNFKDLYSQISKTIDLLNS